MEKSSEMLKGVLEGCVLEIISHGETYGYEITAKLRALGFEDVVEGTVYTVTMRLERAQLVDFVKKPSTMGPPRKFYTLNEAGKKRLADIWEQWDALNGRVSKLRER
jgi:DNA-binding PadR family transcriptional regulator